MRKLLIYLGLLTSLLAIPNVAKADNWAYYLIGDINSWSTNDCQTSTYKFGDTSNSTDNITWYKDYTGAQLDPNADGTAYFKFYVNKNSQYYYYLYNNNGNNNTSVTIGGSTVDVVSNNGSGSFQVTGISQTTIYRIYLQTGTNNDREKGTVRIEAIGTNVTTSSVDLLGTINNWAEATDVLTKDGSEWKLDLTKAQVNAALYNGDFYFRFIENMSNGEKYAVVPTTDQTAITVNAAYTSDTYAFTGIDTDAKKDYYWKFTPTGADNYTIYFKNDGGTRSVKVVDDSPEPWYMHSNLGGADDWSGTTNYPLTYNSTTGYYERTLTESEIEGAKDGDGDVRFRVYDGSGSWGPSSTYTFEQEEGTEEHDLTTTFTSNYISIPKGKYSSAKIEAKKDGNKVLLYVTLTPIVYYWVSPQITNGEKWNYFKMVPSRNRSRDGGDGKTSTKYFTFTMKNDDLVTWKTKSNISDGTKIQWYIERYDGSVVFRPESGEPAATSSGTSLSYTVNNKTYTDSDCGYVNYTDNYKSTNPSSRSGYFAFNKGYNDTSNSHNALAYTFMLNSDNGNVYMDYAHTSASTSVSYDLVGNFTSAKGTVNIDLSNGKEMTKYWYKDGTAYTSEVASADSIVYKVEVQKPSEGWGDLYIDVNVHGNTSWDSYSSVLRPLISLGNNLDGRALHGALTTAKSEQSLNPEPSASYQSYTFSFNATTRTYNLEFHMPDATLSPGYENNEYVFENSWGETITVNYSDATQYATAATKCYIVAGSSSAISLDGVTATEKANLSTFSLTYDGSYIYMNGTRVATGNTVYIKIQGEDASGNKGDVHLYQYTFNAKMSFEPTGGLFINSAKIRINGGVAPYSYEIWHYNTKTVEGETVIDYATNPTKLSYGTFSNGTYANDDNNYRISTPGFLKIIDAQGLEVSYDEVGGGFDFTYSTSENYKHNTTGAAITTVDTSDAGAYPNGADYWQATPGDLTRLLSPTWTVDGSGDSRSATNSRESWNGGNDNTIYLGSGEKIYQTVTDLEAGTYTVQAIVRGGAVPIHLELNDTEVGQVRLTGDGTGSIASINPFGRSEQLENMQESSSARSWHKLEGKATLSAGGSLKIAIRAEGGADVDDVILLKNANTTSGFRTTASTLPTDYGYFDYRRRQVSGQPSQRQNNAYSFFDRGKNQNAVIFANNSTVIAMDPDNLADDSQNTTLKAQDRRHPFNVVGTTEQDAGTGVAKALYLTDMGYDETDANYLPVGIGTSGDANYNSAAYRAHGYTFCPGYSFYAEDLVFDRDMSQITAKKTTCMLPIAITPAQLKTYYGSDLKVYKWSSRSGNDLTFAQQSDNTVLNASEPYIFWNAEGTLDSRGGITAGKTDGKFYIGGITSTNHNAAASHSGFPGTYAYMKVKRYGDADGNGIDDVSSAAETRFGYNASSGVFSVVSANGANLKPFRAYFVVPVTDAAASARQLNIFYDDSIITGIDAVESAATTSGDIYTIGGVLVAKDGNMSGLPKGIYIMNGKKYVVK